MLRSKSSRFTVLHHYAHLALAATHTFFPFFLLRCPPSSPRLTSSLMKAKLTI